MIFKYKFSIWLVDLLLDNEEGLNLQEIQSKWIKSQSNSEGKELTERSFHRYREYAELLFNIDLECERKNGGRYRIKSSEELKTDVGMQWMLNSMRVEELASGIKNSDAVMVEPPSPASFRLRTVLDAVAQGETLELSYKSHFKEEASLFRFIPVFVRLFKQRWYIIGERVDDNSCRTLALERIVEMSAHAEKAKISRKNKDILHIDSYFEHCYGIIRQHEPIAIQFRAFSPQDKYLRDIPLHLSQKEINRGADYTDFEIYVRPTYDLKQELLAQRDKLAVLGPESFKQDMIELLRAMLLSYETGLCEAFDE